MLKLILCIFISYIAGSISPSALIARIKQKDLRSCGTGNLGATNTMLVLGRSYGAFVMVFDIGKGVLATNLGRLLCPQISFAAIAAGCFAVIGHIFPFYLGFRGGKGLATYAGMILALDPLLFSVLLVICLSLMLITNHSVALPYSAAVLFPVFSAVEKRSAAYIAIASCIGAVMMLKHLGNLKKAVNNEDPGVREYIKQMIRKKE